MTEGLNSNEVQLNIQATGDSSFSLTQDAARMVVTDFEFGVMNDIESRSGVGNTTPKIAKKGNVTYEFSFTVEGEDKDMIETVATSNGESREIAFVALGDDVDFDMSSGYLTEIRYSGEDGELVQYSISGIALIADIDS